MVLIDWKRLDAVLLEFAKRGQTSVSFQTVKDIVQTLFTRDAVILPKSRDTKTLKLFPWFVDVWVRAQVVRQELAPDFPKDFYGRLAKANPTLFSWILESKNPLAGLSSLHLQDPVDKQQPREPEQPRQLQQPQLAAEEYKREDPEIPQRRPAAAPSEKSDKEDKEDKEYKTLIGQALVELYEAYGSCRLRRLPASSLSKFRGLMQDHMDKSFGFQRAEQVNNPQDALEMTLNLLLSLDPKLGRISERVSIETRATGERRLISTNDVQVVYLANCEKTLQGCLDALQTPSPISATISHVVELTRASATVFVVFQKPGDVLQLDSAEQVVIDDARFGLAGVLMHVCGHFTTALRGQGTEWIICNDTSAACETIPDLASYMRKIGSTSIRGIMLRKLHKIRPATNVVNFTNISNSCYMSSILQLMFHCGKYVTRLQTKPSAKNAA